MTAAHAFQKDMFLSPSLYFSDSPNKCNRESRISLKGETRCNARMKPNDEIRRDNLIIAVNRVGSASALAELAGVSSVYLSQLKTRSPETKTGTPKSMGDNIARKIERALNEPLGWMDVDRSQPVEQAITKDERLILPLDVVKLFRLYCESTARGRERIIEAAESASKINIPDRRTTGRNSGGG